MPEFPGQTHNFFWREVGALKSLETEVELYSTKRPAPGLQSTSWGSEAASRTVYLHPISLAQAGCIARLLLTSPARSFRSLSAWVSSFKYLNEGESKVRLFALMLLGIWLGHDLRKRGISHVHVHSCADAANIAFFANKAFGITYSMTLHNPIGIWGGNQENKWGNASFGIIITEWIRKELLTKLNTYLPDDLPLAPMGVDVSKFQRRRPYEPYKAGDLQLFCCARLNPAKGFDTLLKATALLNESGLVTRLTIAGEDDTGGLGYRKEIERLILSLGLQDKVRLLGSVAEEVVKEELEQAHLFVLASIEEPLGVAIMEAMAMEVPVVSTQAGGVPELLSNGFGIMVPPGDESALASAIRTTATAEEMSRRLSMNGRSLITERFHHRLSAELIASLTKGLQQDRRTPPSQD